MNRRHTTRPLITASLGALLIIAPVAVPGAWADSGGRTYHNPDGDLYAEPYPVTRLSTEEIRDLLKRNGYPSVYSVRYLDQRDLYVAKVRKRHGRRFNVFVNPWTGSISEKWPDGYAGGAPEPEPAPPHQPARMMTRHDVIMLLQKSGYYNITGPDYRDNVYVAWGEDRTGFRRLVHIDPYSGRIRRVRTEYRGTNPNDNRNHGRPYDPTHDNTGGYPRETQSAPPFNNPDDRPYDLHDDQRAYWRNAE